MISPSHGRASSLAASDGQLRYGKTKGSTSFTDAQRDQIDAESKATLRDLNAGIRQLEEVEGIRRETQTQLAEKRRARSGFGFIDRWAGDRDQRANSAEEELDEAKERDLRAHRESIIWYLRRKLEEAAEMQREMMETRLEREIEKSKSVLYKAKDPRGAPETVPAAGQGVTKRSEDPWKLGMAQLPPEQRSVTVSDLGLSSEQIQIFEQENNDMLKHYEDTLDQVRYV